MRRAALRFARSEHVRRVVLATPASRELAGHYIAGEDLDSTISALDALHARGLVLSVEQLRAEPSEASDAELAANEYLALVTALQDAGLASGTEISLRLPLLGQRLGRDGELLALDLARRVCTAAGDAGCRVTLDMPDHAWVDSTLWVLGQLRSDFPDTGITLQAMLRRTASDCLDLATPGSRVRLCKGTYREPEEVAYRRQHDVDLNFVRCLRLLMRSACYPMIATHDPRMIEITAELARRTDRRADSFEYQMLYGVRPLEQRRLVDVGETVRVYVPYGPEWYRYYIGRLAERPANVTFFLRALLRRR